MIESTMPHSIQKPQLTKMVATGNDFLVFDARQRLNRDFLQSAFPGEDRPQLARRFCDRHTGIGADGLIFLDMSESSALRELGKQAVRWDFYNADGSLAEMCGNAARCVGLFLRAQKGQGERSHYHLETLAGLIDIEVITPQKIHVIMPKIHDFQSLGVVHSLQQESFFVNTGVPHVVVEWVHPHDVDQQPHMRELALKLRGDFLPGGVNVTFIDIVSPTSVHAITFERGVDDFTLSCGTGAVAAAYVAAQRLGTTEPLHIFVPGGELVVDGHQAQAPRLTGSAEFVAEVSLFAKSLLPELGVLKS